MLFIKRNHRDLGSLFQGDSFSPLIYTMKYNFSILFLLMFLLTGCLVNTEVTPEPADTLLELPNTTVDKLALTYDHKKSLWLLDQQLYSGYAVSFHQDGILKEKIGFLQGKKQNRAMQWYPDGHLKQVAHYHKGKLHGEKKVWSSTADHVLLSQLNYRFGKAHGEQKTWYPSGELFKKLNLEKIMFSQY